MIVTAGSTNVSVYYYIVQDASGTSPGDPVTGLLFSDIETGGSASYARQGAARVDLTLVTLASASTAHSDGGFILVDDTNMPGVYRCDYPDAAFVTGVDQVFLSIVVAAANNAVAAPILVDIDDSVDQTGDSFARLGAPAGASISADIADKTGYSLAATGLDAISSTATGMVEIAKAIWDRVLTGATHNIATSAGRRLRGVQDNQAYDDGAIWIDTVNGTAGTTLYENGTSGLPVSTITDALTLATAANVKHLHVVNGSTITLAQTMDNYEITGDEWGLALGSQSCNSLSVHNAHLNGVGVSGIFSGNAHMLHSTIGAITGPNARMGWCALTGTVTSNGTGTWVIHSSWGLSGAQFDFGVGAGQVVYITDWVGGPITIANMGAGDVLYFEGRSAALTIAASCTAGTVFLAGDIALTNSGSGQTINQSSRYELTRIISDSVAFDGADISTILTSIATAQADLDIITDTDGVFLGAAGVDLIWDEPLTAAAHNVQTSSGRRLRNVTSVVIRAELAQGPGTGTNQIQLDTGAIAVDNSYDPTEVAIIAGTGLGQSRMILQYDGATRTATVDRDWVVLPDATSEYVISTNPGREHVNEGLAQAASSTTLTLNARASAVDDVYIGQKIFIRSGTAADEAKLITDYNGTTKVATVDNAWKTTPDTTSAYVMLPHSPVEVSDARIAQLTNIETDTGTTIPALLQEQGIAKNAAFSNFEFLMVLASDGQTPATGLTVTGQRSIDGGAFATVSGAIAEVSNGIYQFDALAADTNGDVITWRFSAGTALDRFVTIKTVQ
jgi:hypothetical protein